MRVNESFAFDLCIITKSLTEVGQNFEASYAIKTFTGHHSQVNVSLPSVEQKEKNDLRLGKKRLSCLKQFTSR